MHYPLPDWTFPLLTAAAAFIYVEVLALPGMILGWLQNLIDKTFLIHVFGCPYCLAGQLTLWLYPAFFWQEYLLTMHVIDIIVAIFAVKIFERYA